ncbi:hypothetical protein L9F63_002769, partial [Diploptera punctata]
TYTLSKSKEFQNLAKNPVDPHVRVAGRLQDVKMAKEKVMEILDTRSNRVTLKMDVSYTDHSHIIGKAGMTIRKVMEDTGCHIHFPDSNRSNPTEKSNQVSIAGELENVEKARARVRSLTPLMFSFPVPRVEPQSLPDINSSYVKSVQEKYCVHVMYKKSSSFFGTMVVIKGREWEVSMVEEATVMIIRYMCNVEPHKFNVQMTLEISPHHHSIVLGKNRSNLFHIMKNTNTQIIFPDASDSNIENLRRSSVTITGYIHDVYVARQQLMGSLPIVLMFDLPEEIVVGTEDVTQLAQRFNVIISLRQKAKQNVVSVIIKGIERNASCVYETRNKLLGVDEPRIIADIPRIYEIPLSQSLPSLNGDTYGSGNGRIRPRLTLNTNYAKDGNVPFIFPIDLEANQKGLEGFWSVVTGDGGFKYSIFKLFNYLFYESQLPSNSSHQPFCLAETKILFSCLSSNTSSLSSPTVSPQSGNSPLQMQTESSNMKTLICIKCHCLAPGCEKKSRENPQMSYNFNAKILAYEAMEIKPLPGEIRLPNPRWAGLGLSQSSPVMTVDQLRREGFNTSLLDEAAGTDASALAVLHSNEHGENRDLCLSDYLDSNTPDIVNKIIDMDIQTLDALLVILGLERFI